MFYKYFKIDNVAEFDPYTIPSRLEDAKAEWFIFGNLDIPLLGGRIATREIEAPSFSIIPSWECSMEIELALTKTTMILLDTAREKNINKVIVVFAFDKLPSHDSSMYWIDIKAALFRLL